MEKHFNKINFKDLLKLLLPLLLATFSFFFISINIPYFFGLDPWFHLSMIKEIINTGTFSITIPLDPTYPNVIPPLFHIFSANLSILINILPETIIRYIPLLLGLLIIAFVFIIARQLFDIEVAFLSAILTSLIPTTILSGGALLARPQLMGELFLLVLIWILYIYKDDFSVYSIFLISLILLSLPLMHSFSGFVLLPIIMISFLLTIEKNYKLKKFIILLITILFAIVSYYLSIFLKWGLPKTENTYAILSEVIAPSLSFNDFYSFFGIIFAALSLLSIILLPFIRGKENKKTRNFVLIWFFSLVLLLFLGKIGLLSILPKRLFYESIFPLILIISLFISYLYSITSKRILTIFLIFLITIQLVQVITFNPVNDNLSESEYSSFQHISLFIDKEEFVATDSWSCYYLSAISDRKCYYLTGFYSKTYDREKILVDLFNNHLNQSEITFNKLLIFKPLTFIWINIKHYKLNGNYLSEKEIYSNLEKLEKEGKFKKIY